MAFSALLPTPSRPVPRQQSRDVADTRCMSVPTRCLNIASVCSSMMTTKKARKKTPRGLSESPLRPHGHGTASLAACICSVNMTRTSTALTNRKPRHVLLRRARSSAATRSSLSLSVSSGKRYFLISSSKKLRSSSDSWPIVPPPSAGSNSHLWLTTSSASPALSPLSDNSRCSSVT